MLVVFWIFVGYRECDAKDIDQMGRLTTIVLRDNGNLLVLRSGLVTYLHNGVVGVALMNGVVHVSNFVGVTTNGRVGTKIGRVGTSLVVRQAVTTVDVGPAKDYVVGRGAHYGASATAALLHRLDGQLGKFAIRVGAGETVAHLGTTHGHHYHHDEVHGRQEYETDAHRHIVERVVGLRLFTANLGQGLLNDRALERDRAVASGRGCVLQHVNGEGG